MANKSWWQSKSIWGSLLVVVATGLQVAGIDIGDPSGWVESLMQLMGAGLAIYGRIKAVKKIGKA